MEILKSNFARHVRGCGASGARDGRDMEKEEGRGKDKGRVAECRCVKGPFPTPRWRGTRRAASSCGTPEVGQAPDQGRMATNENGSGTTHNNVVKSEGCNIDSY